MDGGSIRKEGGRLPLLDFSRLARFSKSSASRSQLAAFKLG
jgi:hypothetical protein